MKLDTIEKLKTMLSDDGCGFGDPDARRNAELMLQTLLAEQQTQTAKQLNVLTLLLVISTFINLALTAVSIFR